MKRHNEKTMREACANCGASGPTIIGGDLQEEAVCSQRCYDQLIALGCPHEHVNAYRNPVETDELLALRRVADVARGFMETVRDAEEAIAARGRGGQQVGFHGDFAAAPPSTMGRLRWWANSIAAALKETSDA